MNGQRFMPLLVVAAGLLAYCNSFTGVFFDDDFGSILENSSIHHLWSIRQCLSPPHRGGWTVEGRPLINLSLAISYALSGYKVWGYHTLNLTVHILAGLTLLGIMRRTLMQPVLRQRFGAAANELALATAVLWTVHPLQTESVTYISQRAESIMGLFYLLTLYCFIRGVESRVPRIWYSLSVIACTLGMACKEVMASAPLMVMLYDRAFLSGSFRELWRRRWPLYVALASTWILLGYLLTLTIRNALANADRIGLTWWQYLATQPGVILYYLRLSVWPFPLSLYYKWPIARMWRSILPPTVPVAVLLVASAWTWRRYPVWGFVGAWFFLILVPSSSFIPLQDALYEHRMYLSLAAVVSLVVMGAYTLLGRRSLVVFVVAAIGLGCLTGLRNQDYHSEIAMQASALARSPNNPLAHYRLGFALQKAGRVQEAIDHFERALQLDPDIAGVHYYLGVALARADRIQEAMGHWEQALRREHNSAEMHDRVGLALKDLGRVPEAIQHYEQALRLEPDLAEAHYNLGSALLEVGDLQSAIEHYKQALRLKPDLVEAHNSLGFALAQQGKIEEAKEHYAQALRLKPDYGPAHNNLGNALLQQGKVMEAVSEYKESLRINPDNAETHNNLGNALFQQGKWAEAIGRYEQAVRLKPDFAEAHDNLGIALKQAGRVQEAVEHYKQTLRIKPDYATAHYNLGNALLGLGNVPEAIEHYERALQIKRDFVEAHYNLGVALEQMGKSEDAMRHYEQALRLKPDYTEAKNRLARLRAAQ